MLCQQWHVQKKNIVEILFTKKLILYVSMCTAKTFSLLCWTDFWLWQRQTSLLMKMQIIMNFCFPATATVYDE